MAKDGGFQKLNFVPVSEKLATKLQRCYATNSDDSVNDVVIILTGHSDKAGRKRYKVVRDDQ